VTRFVFVFICDNREKIASRFFSLSIGYEQIREHCRVGISFQQVLELRLVIVLLDSFVSVKRLGWELGKEAYIIRGDGERRGMVIGGRGMVIGGRGMVIGARREEDVSGW